MRGIIPLVQAGPANNRLAQQHEHYDHVEVICFATNFSKVNQLASKMFEVNQGHAIFVPI